MSKLKIKKASQLNLKGLYKFERWADLEKFESGKYKGIYKISTFGRVFSVRRGKILKHSACGTGYLKVCLYKNGKCQTVTIHRLVATEFIPNPGNRPCIDHIDVNPKNNRVENLRWVTQRENQNNIISLSNRKKNSPEIVAYCVLDNGNNLPLAVYKGLRHSEREAKAFGEGVSWRNISQVLNPNSYRKTCGKIRATKDASDRIRSLITTHNLEGKEIYWTYAQDWEGFDLEEYLNNLV